MGKVSLTINGKQVEREVEDRTLLVNFIRDEMRLTGTHIGCDTTQCGACMVHVGGKAMKSCTLLVVQVEGEEITTIEGLAIGEEMHPVQAAFKEHHGLQCGYCTPGMIMSAVDIIRRHGSSLTDEQIKEDLEGNICRCTGYVNIVKSISAAASEMNAGAPARDK